jgi:hypothetical protein
MATCPYSRLFSQVNDSTFAVALPSHGDSERLIAAGNLAATACLENLPSLKFSCLRAMLALQGKCEYERRCVSRT